MDDTSGVAVDREIELPADVDDVWPFLTSSDFLSTWMEGRVEIDPRPGGRITLTREGLDLVWGTVEEVDEPHRIQWSWRTDDGLPTLVEIEIWPTGKGTSLTVRETLLPWRVSGPDAVYFDATACHLSILERAA